VVRGVSVLPAIAFRDFPGGQQLLHNYISGFTCVMSSTAVTTKIRTSNKEEFMAKCVRCGKETCLYISGTPVCLDCARKKAEIKIPELEKTAESIPQLPRV
jgi:hypothetical protein